MRDRLTRIEAKLETVRNRARSGTHLRSLDDGHLTALKGLQAAAQLLRNGRGSDGRQHDALVIMMGNCHN